MPEFETLPYLNADAWLRYNTHGHVVENKNGVTARCGGEAFCDTCKVERELKTLIDENRKQFRMEQ